MVSLIEIKNLKVKYAPSEPNAVNGISLTIKEGEKIALFGDNGAGKTTLLLAIIGILPPSEGEIFVGGLTVDKKNLPLVRKNIGFVFQNPDDQLFMPTVAEDIAFGMKNLGEAQADIAGKCALIMEELGITALKDSPVHKLSGGEKRMAALAGVLVMSPKIILLDEPTSFLDMKARRRLENHLRSLSQSMVITTHDLCFAYKTCSRAVFLRSGRIAADCPIAELPQRHELLAEFGFEE